MIRKFNWMTLIIPLFILMGFSIRDTEPETQYRPVLLSRNDLPKSVFHQSAREFSLPGKIYLYGQWIFVVDQYTGIHVIDNTNPSAPVKSGFIHIPGVLDVAVRDSVLFADNAVDLVSINLRTYPGIQVLDRIRDVFPEPTPPDLNYIPASYASRNRPKNTVIVGWEK